MYIEQLYTNCLAEAAYYIESDGEVAIIDPIRETTPYLELAAARGAKIKFIFETHFHADFVSGHIDLANHTGATIVYGPEANPQYKAHVARDGEVFKLGKIAIQVLHTPGHTLESSCFLLKDETGADHAIFTGDTLFVGAVGRPDLAVKGEKPITPAELGSLMYDSLRNKIMPLADEVIVYPAHGPGSSCGKGIGKETWSTMGVQKVTNYALQPMTREEFVAQVTENLPSPPAYFFEDARINQMGYDSISDVLARNVVALEAKEVATAIQNGAIVLDTRPADEFEQAFIPNAINIGLNGGFAVWVGTLLPIDRPMIVVAQDGKEEESILRLARVGFENVLGYLKGGMSTWKSAEMKTDAVKSITPEEIKVHLGAPHTHIIDVRKPGEFASGHVLGARNLELDTIESQISTLDPNDQYVIHCQGGYRSMVAASILKRGGIHNLVNVLGGYAAIAKTAIPVEKNQEVLA